MTIWTRLFWLDAADRAVRTAAQAALAVAGADGLGIRTAGWAALGTIGGLAAAASLLTSLATARVGAPGTAALFATAAAPIGRHSR